MRVVSLLLIAALFSGCADLPGFGEDEAQCPTDDLRRSAYSAGEAHMENQVMAWNIPFAMTLVGTLEGDVDNILLKVKPADRSFHMSTNDFTMTFAEPYFSYEDGMDDFYSRDYNPVYYDEMKDTFTSDDDEQVSFLDDLTVEDYTANCADLSGVGVIEYSYAANGVEDRFAIEQAVPNRLLTGHTVDPALQDNYRISVSYDVPSITVKDTLPKLPLTWMLEADLQEFNERGGLYMEATFVDGTEWAPFSELEFHLVGDDDTLYAAEQLEDGAWDLGDGDYFEYTDEDNNQMLSTGDTIIMDLGPGLDIQFYDLWADDYTF